MKKISRWVVFLLGIVVGSMVLPKLVEVPRAMAAPNYQQHLLEEERKQTRALQEIAHQLGKISGISVGAVASGN